VRLFCVGLMILIAGCNPFQKSVSEQGRRKAPDFRLKDENQKEVKLSDFKGEVLLLHFWASWCPPCIDELPVLMRMAEKMKNDKVRIVMVSLDRSWKEARSVWPPDAKSPNLISLIDPDTKVPELYGAFQYPETFMIDRNLRIVTKFVGPQKWDHDEIIEAFRKLL